MAEDDQDRSEQPTSKKLEKAREEGNVAQSAEIPTVVVLSTALVFCIFAGTWMWTGLLDMARKAFLNLTPGDLTADSLPGILLPGITDALLILAPLLLAIMVLGTASYVGQFGLMWSAKVLAPDLNKLNPANGLKRLFSLRSVFEAVKGFAKISLIGVIVYYAIQQNMDSIMALAGLPPVQVLAGFWTMAHLILLRVIGALLILALIDFLYQKYTYNRQQMMSKQEVKDEFKNTEGDPKIKGRIRRIQMEMATRRMMQQVPKADVVITNPTHISVALRYRRKEDRAPVVIAKGADFVALQIRFKAEAAGVPILERKPLAQALYRQCEIGDAIPTDLYQAVAEVLAFIFSKRAEGFE